MHPVRISADYWLRHLTYLKLLLNNHRQNVGKAPSNKCRYQFFKWPHAPLYTPAVSRNDAAIAAIQICNDTGACVLAQCTAVVILLGFTHHI